MKITKIIVLGCMLILGVLFLYSCKKKSEPASSSSSETQMTQEQLKAAVAEKSEEIKEIVDTLKADVNTSISEIKAEIEKLNVDQLRETALQYKQLITEKTKQIDNLNEKIKGIALTELMSEESMALRKELGDLTTGFDALKERFQLYYNKLKEKGGDLTGLSLTNK